MLFYLEIITCFTDITFTSSSPNNVQCSIVCLVKIFLMENQIITPKYANKRVMNVTKVLKI